MHHHLRHVVVIHSPRQPQPRLVDGNETASVQPAVRSVVYYKGPPNARRAVSKHALLLSREHQRQRSVRPFVRPMR